MFQNMTTIHLALSLAVFLSGAGLSNAGTNETPRLISADLMLTNGPLNTMFKHCLGAGRANEGLRADWQRQLSIAHWKNMKRESITMEPNPEI